MPPTKVALVTGSGKRRIGWHVAHALAERGYALGIHYRTSQADAADTVSHLQDMGVQAVALQADLADENAVRALVQGLGERFGRLDVLVNCAASWKSKRLEEVTAAAEEQGASTQEMAASAGELLQAAEKLRALVKGFRV